MATWTSDPSQSLDSWYGNASGPNYGNGQGPRLVAGYYGSLDWLSRMGLSFKVSGLFGLLASSAQMSAATLTLTTKASNSCMASGTGPRTLFERGTQTVTENSLSGNCELGGGGGPSTGVYPGINIVTANRAGYSGSPADNVEINVDVLAMLKDLYDASPGATYFSLVGRSANNALNAYDDTTGSARLVVNSRHVAGKEPTLTVVYSTNSPPNTPTSLLAPQGRRSGATLPTYDFDFSDPDGGQCYRCNIQVATASDFSSGMLWDSGMVVPTTAAAGRATLLHSGTAPVRGTQYYWRVKVRDSSLADSGWSAGTAFSHNQFPTATKVAPA